MALALLLPSLALAEDGVTTGQFFANNVWMMLCAGLVFIMHLGFATLESGLTRAKNTTNILFKNTFIVSVGILTYALCGFNLMYPGDFNGILGFAGAGLGAGHDAASNTPGYADGGYTYWTDFLFQALFAATVFGVIKASMGLRVSEEEELEGLDYGEHGMHAYDFGGASSISVGGGRTTGASAHVATQLATENG